MNPKYVSRQRVLQLTISGTAEVGDREIELAPREYRLHFDEFDDGRVCLTQLDRKCGETWLRDKLWHGLDEALTDALEADIAREQQEIVESYDAHGWRYGS